MNELTGTGLTIHIYYGVKDSAFTQGEALGLITERIPPSVPQPKARSPYLAPESHATAWFCFSYSGSSSNIPEPGKIPQQ